VLDEFFTKFDNALRWYEAHISFSLTMTNWMENVNNFQCMMLRDTFLDTLWATGIYVLGLFALVATRFTVKYLTSGRPRVILPKTSTVTTATCAMIGPIVAEEAFYKAPAPVQLQPVQAPAPVKVQPLKSRQVKPTNNREVTEAPPIECAKCGKQIKSPPVLKQGSTVQYKCEHCGANLALA
jgi:DNA-directed RNA polymerase subunit RPC12/RpoP